MFLSGVISIINSVLNFKKRQNLNLYGFIHLFLPEEKLNNIKICLWKYLLTELIIIYIWLCALFVICSWEKVIFIYKRSFLAKHFIINIDKQSKVPTDTTWFDIFFPVNCSVCFNPFRYLTEWGAFFVMSPAAVAQIRHFLDILFCWTLVEIVKSVHRKDWMFP